MVEFNEGLDQQFKELRFPDYQRMVLVPSSHDDRPGIFQLSQVKWETEPNGIVNREIEFVFDIRERDHHSLFTIEKIRATIIGRDKEDIYPIVKQEFELKHPIAIDKDIIVRELFKGMARKEVAKKFGIGEKKTIRANRHSGRIQR